MQNSWDLHQYLLEIMGKKSQRNLVPKSLLSEVLQTFKVEKKEKMALLLSKNEKL